MSTGAWLAAGAATAATVGYRGYRNALDVRVEHVTLVPHGLPDALDGVRVLLLSDLHFPGVANAPRRLESLLDGVDADVALLAGDLVDTQASVGIAAEALGRVARRWPSYAVFGAHDHLERHTLRQAFRGFDHVNDGAAFRAELERHDVHVLHNERATVQLRGGDLDLIGLADHTLHLDDLDAALGGRPLDGFGLVVSHHPDVLPAVSSRGLPVLLAGHTHGGQIAFPVIGAPLTHSRLFRWRYPAGLMRRGSTLAYVGRGFGTTLLPLRYNARPEITVVTLTCARGAGA
jgi:predicted MPP superfamily phosphohydrolase